VTDLTVTLVMDDKHIKLICRGTQRGKVLGSKWDKAKKEGRKLRNKCNKYRGDA
jgi:hypothetical protein